MCLGLIRYHHRMDDRFAVRRTPRLILRRPTEADLEPMARISCDPRTNEHRPGGPPTPDQGRTIVRSFLVDWRRYGIGYWVVERDGRIVGMTGVKPVAIFGRSCWNLYYRYTPAVWGLGLASEAAREAVAAAREHTPGWPVVVRTRPGNAPATRLARALGMCRAPDLDGDGFIAFAHPPDEAPLS